MKVELARYAGFCMGVRRALSLCMEQVRKGIKPIYTLGPIIHNSTVTEKLKSFGVKNLNSDDVPVSSSMILIRSHGITPKLRTELNNKGYKLCDATCPKVARVQSIIKSHVLKGYNIVIIGDHGHAETQGLLGYSDDKGTVIATKEEAELFIKNTEASTPICVVAQTTQEPMAFKNFCNEFVKYFKTIKIIDTICDATRKRQEEVSQRAKEFDCIIVAGGRNSANTSRLYETAVKYGKKAFHIEDFREINNLDLSSCKRVLVTAGASTPFWIIHQIKETLEGKKLSSRLMIFLASRGFAIFSFISSFLLAVFLLGSGAYLLLGLIFSSALLLSSGLYSMYIGNLDVFDKKRPYTSFSIVLGFILLIFSVFFVSHTLLLPVLYYGLLFYVIYKNKAITRRLLIGAINISFWILLGGVIYGW